MKTALALFALLNGATALLMTPPPPSLHRLLNPPQQQTVPSAISRVDQIYNQLTQSPSSTSMTPYILTWLLAPGDTTTQFATPAQVEKALLQPSTVLLDARSDEEILQDGFIAIRGHKWVHASGTIDENPLLEATASSQLPDKTAPVIVYCGSGKRAAMAKEILDRKGYTQVLNAGAFPDLDYLKGRAY